MDRINDDETITARFMRRKGTLEIECFITAAPATIIRSTQSVSQLSGPIRQGPGALLAVNGFTIDVGTRRTKRK